MKKIVALLLAAMMLFALAGCAKTEKTDWAYIEDKGELIVGITLFAPMNYHDENGELTGFETEFAKALGEKLGVDVKFQEITWSAKETELNSKNIDCIWNGMTITPERLETMDISVPYMENKQVLVVKAENVDAMADLAGKSIVAEKESAGETVAQNEAAFAEASYTPVDSQAKALMEVASGTADGAVIDYVMSIGSIGEGTDYADLVVVEGAAFSPEQYGIAFRKDSPETLQKVNDAIAALAADGTLNDIAAKYKLADLLLVK